MANKGVDTIQYNLLNLPQEIVFANGDRSLYKYNAAGKKYQVIYCTHIDNELNPIQGNGVAMYDTLTYDYDGSYVYRDHYFNMLMTPDGYVHINDLTPENCFYAKDHLGNNRATYYVTPMAELGVLVKDINNYYPYGMEFNEKPAVVYAGFNPELDFTYNGKEFQTMHGLNMLDYGARFIDMAKPDWIGRDPLCEMKPWQSPYMYCSGNPVNRTDPTGLYDYPDDFFTVTAPAPKNKNNNNNFNFAFQQLLNNANRNMAHMPRITPPTPAFNLPTNTNANNVVINNKDSKKGDGTLQNISEALAAIGISESAVEIAVTESGGKQIVYVTLKGTTAIANVAKVSSVLKNIGGYTFYLGAIVDVARAANGEQSWVKAGFSTGVAYTAMKVGGWPGFLIGGGYILLDKLGAFDGSPENLPYYQQPTCPIDATKTVIPNYTH